MLPLIVHSKGEWQCPSGEIFMWGTAAVVVMRVSLVNGHDDVKAITANTHSWPPLGPARVGQRRRLLLLFSLAVCSAICIYRRRCLWPRASWGLSWSRRDHSSSSRQSSWQRGLEGQWRWAMGPRTSFSQSIRFVLNTTAMRMMMMMARLSQLLHHHHRRPRRRQHHPFLLSLSFILLFSLFSSSVYSKLMLFLSFHDFFVARAASVCWDWKGPIGHRKSLGHCSSRAKAIAAAASSFSPLLLLLPLRSFFRPALHWKLSKGGPEDNHFGCPATRGKSVPSAVLTQLPLLLLLLPPTSSSFFYYILRTTTTTTTYYWE